MRSLFITLFLLSSCNIYELVGQETEFSDEFEEITGGTFPLEIENYPYFDFGVHSSLHTETLVLTNLSDQNVPLTGNSFSGANPAQFAYNASSTCGASLTPFSTCNIDLDYNSAGSGVTSFATFQLDYDFMGNSDSLFLDLEGTGL